MSAALEYARYPSKGHDELCLRVGVQHAKTILLVPPLFDEMNRMRRMLVDVMRLLDARDIGTALPDLPGTNESLFPQEQVSLVLWREALAHCLQTLPECRHVASFRGGCLIDNISDDSRQWRFAPAKGSMLLRRMMRTRIASDKEAGLSTDMAKLTAEAQQGQVNLAGNSIGSAMFSELQDAEPAPPDDIRTAQLKNSAQRGDVALPGSALWLRAEPDDDLLLSQAIANDLLSWMSS